MNTFFPYEQAIGELGENGPIYGPGDLLTLLYVYHPNIQQPDRENLLAARSLIHSKIVANEKASI